MTHFRNPQVNLDARRFAVTRSLTPLCIGKIEMPDRSTWLAGDDACAKNAGPAVVTPSIVLFDKTRCPFAGMVDALLDDIGHHRKHRATVLCAGFEDVAECKQLDPVSSAFPEVPRNTACRAWSSRCCGQASFHSCIG